MTQVRSTDPFTYKAMPVFLVTAAAVASYLPARRTTAVDLSYAKIASVL